VSVAPWFARMSVARCFARVSVAPWFARMSVARFVRAGGRVHAGCAARPYPARP